MFAPQDVKNYYNKFTGKYLEIYGDVIQAFRPKNTNALLEYLLKSIHIKYKSRIIDAGCGVGGPAIFFAKKRKCYIDAITVSEEQVKIAKQKVLNEKLNSFIKISEGDYHNLTDYFDVDAYDGVLFLESLGHAENPEKVIHEAYKCLKRGAYIYIKDFFIKKVDNIEHQKKIDKVIQNMNYSYSYNTLDLNNTISSIRSNNMEILFIKKFDFKDDTTIRAKFEASLNMDIFEGIPEFYPAEWLEIKCIKV